MLRTGSRASSERFETVSIPVYAIIPIGIASRKFGQVGAAPKWTFAVSRCGLKTRKKPRSTSKTCVAKSTAASATLIRADSWMPTMFSATRTTMTTAPPMMSHGFERSGSQKIDR